MQEKVTKSSLLVIESVENRCKMQTVSPLLTDIDLFYYQSTQTSHRDRLITYKRKNMMTDTLALGGWAVTFGKRRGTRMPFPLLALPTYENLA